MTPRTVAELLEDAAGVLAEAGVPEHRRQARDLLAFAMDTDAAFLIAHPEAVPEEPQASSYEELVKRRATREPFQQITGRQEFYGLEFRVTRDVMVPRPETELIVTAGIELLSDTPNARICEVGVGSGCIIVSLLHEMPEASGVALDISEAAIGVAQQNALSTGVLERLEFRRSDVFSALLEDERFDLIASNPPYVPAADVSGLQPEVREFEPLVALTDGSSGLSIIERIVRQSTSRLKPGGHLLLEIGFSQSAAVLRMFDPGIWDHFEAFPDLQGIPRMIRASLSST